MEIRRLVERCVPLDPLPVPCKAYCQHLLHLFPPHTTESPSSPSPYLYLAQCAPDPQEALGYYSTAAALLEKEIATQFTNGQMAGASEEGEGMKKMAVTALVAMIEIWMSDLWCVPFSA